MYCFQVCLYALCSFAGFGFVCMYGFHVCVYALFSFAGFGFVCMYSFHLQLGPQTQERTEAALHVSHACGESSYSMLSHLTENQCFPGFTVLRQDCT